MSNSKKQEFIEIARKARDNMFMRINHPNVYTWDEVEKDLAKVCKSYENALKENIEDPPEFYECKDDCDFQYLSIKDARSRQVLVKKAKDFYLANNADKITTIKWIREQVRTTWGTIGLKVAKELVEEFMLL
jgi:hypothetical protein